MADASRGAAAHTAAPSGSDLPYPPRPGQVALNAAAYGAFASGRHAVLEAGTGTGKTVAVLAAALRAAAEGKRRVVWLTRTNSQSVQVMREAAAILGHAEARTAAQAPFLAMALQGRRHLCPQLAGDPRYAGADAEEYARLCGSLKRATLRDRGDPENLPWRISGRTDPEHDEPTVRPSSPRSHVASKGCGYYSRLLDMDPQPLASQLEESPLDAEGFARLMESQGGCPYEAAKGLLVGARLVVVPYIYLAVPRLARALMDWMGATLAECLIVVDEAHNLPDYLRELHSPELSGVTLERAESEARETGDPFVAAGLRASRFVRIVSRVTTEIAREHIIMGDQEDALVPAEDLTVPLMGHLGVTSIGLLGIVEAVAQLGARVRDAALAAGRLPRSYLGALARFIAAWMHAVPGEHVHVVVDGEPPRLVLHCLDASLGAGFLRDAHASVHMSGTLRPLEQHRDLLGLPPDTHLAAFGSPYAKEHLRLVLVDDVTTQYDLRQREPGMMDRLAEHVRRFAEVQGVNAALFFPSHALLAEMRELALADLDRVVHVEEPGLSQAELMMRLAEFRAAGRAVRVGGPGALWLGVMGGRVAEGMDLPAEELEAVCIVGVPYPKPTARQRALVRFHEIRHQAGWEYAVTGPTLRRVLQAMGRVVRDAQDRGIVFFLDARYRRWSTELGRLERLEDEETIGSTLEGWVRQARSLEGSGHFPSGPCPPTQHL